MMSTFMEILGSKKALVALVLVIAASVLTYTARMNVEQWIEFTKWVAGVWMLAQGAEDAMVKSATVKATLTPPMPSAPPVDSSKPGT